MTNARRLISVLVTLLAAAAGAACESVPLLAPTQSTVRLVVADTALPHGGSTTVTAAVTEAAGTPVHDGTVVTFSTTLGAIHPPEAPTTRGHARATFTAGPDSGAADIVAYSGDAFSASVQVVIGAAAVAAVRLGAHPASLPPGGGTAGLVATVLDAAQNPLPAVRVTFSATAGTLRDRIVTTDAAGEASTVLATTTAAAVTAAAGEASDTRAIAIDPETAIGLTAAPARPTVGQPVAFEVTLRNEARAVRSAAIDFGDGHTQPLRAAATVSATHTYATAGGYTVTVTAIDTAGHAAAASISFQVRPAPGIPVTVAATSPEPVAGEAVAFTVEVSPPADAPAVRDVVIDFGDASTLSLGALAGRRSVAHVYGREGSYVVAVEVLDAAGRRHTASIGLRVRPAPGIAVAITASPAAPTEGQPVTFLVDVSRPAGAPAVREVTLDFGDLSEPHAFGALTGRASVAHIYADAGSYIVTVAVRDTAGRQHTSSIGIVVAEE